MKVCRSIVSSILLSSLVAACGTTAGARHQDAAHRYTEAAQAARSRGDSTEAMRDEALARQEERDAQDEAERLAVDDWAP
jgi:hypothetical protein